jgi:hypothetical protein
VGPRLGAPRVGSHQALLHGEDQVLGRSHGPRSCGVGLPEPDLERANGRRQRRRDRSLLHEPQLLDPIEQPVGLRQQAPPVEFGLQGVGL